MNLPRVKELLAAWETGTAREADLAELRGLLPAVIAAAEAPSTNKVLTREARAWVGTARTAAIKAMPALRPILIRAYMAGALRLGRSGTI